LFAEKARELLEKDKVAVVFGCWTSVSRKSVLPVFEKDNGLLFYPVQYEGEESSKNVICTGAAPNQQAIPAVDYLMKEVGVKRWVLEGTDYVYPRTTNKILEAYLKAKGVADDWFTPALVEKPTVRVPEAIAGGVIAGVLGRMCAAHCCRVVVRSRGYNGGSAEGWPSGRPATARQTSLFAYQNQHVRAPAPPSVRARPGGRRAPRPCGRNKRRASLIGQHASLLGRDSEEDRF
jgi:hypothetical protein